MIFTFHPLVTPSFSTASTCMARLYGGAFPMMIPVMTHASALVESKRSEEEQLSQLCFATESFLLNIMRTYGKFAFFHSSVEVSDAICIWNGNSCCSLFRKHFTFQQTDDAACLVAP